MLLCDRPDIHQIYLCLGKNSGKSFFSACMICWTVYKLVCMQPTPQDFLPNIAPGSGIQIINLATDGDQAKRSVFLELSIKIAGHGRTPASPWFQRLGYKPLSDRFIFPTYNIELKCGHSRAEAWLGANTILGIIDEASYFKDAPTDIIDTGYPTSLAERNYNAFYGSCRTRFPDYYKIILISSPKHMKDFLFEKISQVKRAGVRVDIDSVTTKHKFPEKLQATEEAIEVAKLGQYDIGMQIYIDGERIAVHAPTWELRNDDTILNYQTDFHDNPTIAARDFGAQPYYSFNPYFNYGNLKPCFLNSRPTPLPFLPRSPETPELDLPESATQQRRRLDIHFRGEPGRQYFAHIDYATGGSRGRTRGQGDACGLAMGHLEDIILGNGERDRMVVFDLVTRFQYQDDTPIDSEEVCDFLLYLQCGRRGFRPPRRLEAWETRDGLGFTHLSITIDGFNYELLSQQLAKRSLSVAYFSPDKTIQPWHETQLFMYQGRVQIYPHPILQREFKSLQHTVKGMPDHPTGESKDILDAVVSVIHRAIWHPTSTYAQMPYKAVNG